MIFLLILSSWYGSHCSLTTKETLIIFMTSFKSTYSFQCPVHYHWHRNCIIPDCLDSGWNNHDYHPEPPKGTKRKPDAGRKCIVLCDLCMIHSHHRNIMMAKPTLLITIALGNIYSECVLLRFGASPRRPTTNSAGTLNRLDFIDTRPNHDDQFRVSVGKCRWQSVFQQRFLMNISLKLPMF